VHGGYGYTRDFPVEQYAHDVKILSIWEGTNHIQSVDLIRDKLGLGNNPKLLKLYTAEVQAFLADPATPRDTLHQSLRDALDCLVKTVGELGELVLAKKMELVLLNANRFLGMMSTVTVAWLLLEAAVIAKRSLAQLPDGHRDLAFYRGKVLSARFFFGEFLATVFHDAARIREAEDSALDADREIFLMRMDS
jgi:hypothetical protein